MLRTSMTTCRLRQALLKKVFKLEVSHCALPPTCPAPLFQALPERCGLIGGILYQAACQTAVG